MISFKIELVSFVPNRYLPQWAEIKGMRLGPMEEYCKKQERHDRLPRGMDEKLGSLRKRIINHIKSR